MGTLFEDHPLTGPLLLQQGRLNSFLDHGRCHPLDFHQRESRENLEYGSLTIGKKLARRIPAATTAIRTTSAPAT